MAQVVFFDTSSTTAVADHALLTLVSEGRSPWVIHDVAWNSEFLARLLAGADTGMTYIEHATQKLGAGDLCILTERQAYEERTRIAAGYGVWTLDSAPIGNRHDMRILDVQAVPSQ